MGSRERRSRRVSRASRAGSGRGHSGWTPRRPSSRRSSRRCELPTRRTSRPASASWSPQPSNDGGARPDDGEAHADDADGPVDAACADGASGNADGEWSHGLGVPVLDADGVRLQARVWAEYLDPDGAAPDEHDEQRRFLTLHAPRHGLVPISGLLLPQVAASLRCYADAWTSPRTPAVDDPTRGVAPSAVHGPVATSSGPAPDATSSGPASDATSSDRAPEVLAETRSRAQVLHDVLATVVVVAARAADAPSIAGNPATLVVVARAEDLASGDGVAHADDGSVVSLPAALHVGCAGAVQRVNADGSGRIVGLWSAERCFTGAQRRAIAVRDGGCVIPGCTVPPGWCEAHHVVPHADDPGGTHTDNGVLLCWHHHRTIDTSGWRVRMVDGLPWVSPPSWLDPRRAWRPARPGPGASSAPGRSSEP